MCQKGLKILLRAIVRHGPKTGDLPSVWLDTCGSLPYQPDALARVAASPSQGFAGSKASRGQRLRGIKPCSGLRKAGRRPRTGFAGPFKGAGPLFGHRDLESRSPGRRSSGRAVSSLFEDALGHADVLSQFTRPGQGTIDATNQMVEAIGMIQAVSNGPGGYHFFGQEGTSPKSVGFGGQENGTGPILDRKAGPSTGRGILISAHPSRATRGTIGRL